MTRGSSIDTITPAETGLCSNPDFQRRRSQDFGSNPFQSNDYNRLPTFKRLRTHDDPTMINIPMTSEVSYFSPHRFQKVGLENEISQRQSHDFSVKSVSDYSNAGGSVRLPSVSPRKGDDTAYKSALDTISNSPQSLLFEEKIAILTNSESTRNGKEWVLKDDIGDVDMLQNRANSMDEVVSHIFDDEKGEDSDSLSKFQADGVDETTKGMTKKKRLMNMVVLGLLTFIVGSGVLAGFPVFTCNNSYTPCYPQLRVQLTDKSPAAKSALVTVKEALKVLSYLALDFGDTYSDLDLINTSLDTYYQDKVIDTFNVDTVYQINALGYCRSSVKNRKDFCMKSYGFDLLSVFVRDAGVQLAELTKTNINLMGDSFAIAYDLAISGFNQLTTVEGNSQEYLGWAILLQKFSKGLGFLVCSQFVIDCVLLIESVSLLALINTNIHKQHTRNITHILKKALIISMTFLGFVGITVGFLICSLILEYYLKLTELAQSAGIANVVTGLGFSLIWVSFVSHVVSLVFIIYLANSFRKGVF